MKLKKILLAAACVLALATTAPASADKPGQGVTVSPARATWNTGFFQEALVRRGLEELGYTVRKPKDLANPLAYKSIALGDLDYWTNGWFPLHDPQLPADFADKCELVGYVAKAGGLQGYLVSKKHVEEFGIKSLEDFKRPEVIKAFDANGNGKADLTACPPGWGCETAIAHHMEVYGLKEYVNPIKASYEAGMANAVGAFKSGEPVFFYTWTPNWTTYVLKPGVDVMWINVPEIMPSEAQKGAEDRMTVAGVEGAVSDPIDLGFVVSDIRIAANKKFLSDNPAARKFFEGFSLPLSDINAQNSKMNEGEKSQRAIEKHVDAWIAANKATWDGWLKAARDAAK